MAPSVSQLLLPFGSTCEDVGTLESMSLVETHAVDLTSAEEGIEINSVLDPELAGGEVCHSRWKEVRVDKCTNTGFGWTKIPWKRWHHRQNSSSIKLFRGHLYN